MCRRVRYSLALIIIEALLIGYSRRERGRGVNAAFASSAALRNRACRPALLLLWMRNPFCKRFGVIRVDADDFKLSRDGLSQPLRILAMIEQSGGQKDRERRHQNPIS